MNCKTFSAAFISLLMIMLWSVTLAACGDDYSPDKGPFYPGGYFILAESELPQICEPRTPDPRPVWDLPEEVMETAGLYPYAAENVRGWLDMLELPVTEETAADMYFNLYMTDLERSEALEKAVMLGKVPDASHQGPVTRRLATEEARGPALFLDFLRAREKYHLDAQSWWVYQPSLSNEELRMRQELLSLARARFETTSGQLRMRYAFQVMDILFYSNLTEEAVAFFEEELADAEASPILEWCRSHYAGALPPSESAKAFAAFSLVRNGCERYGGDSAESSLKMIGMSLADDPLVYARSDWERERILLAIEDFARNRWKLHPLSQALLSAPVDGGQALGEYTARQPETALAEFINRLEEICYNLSSAKVLIEPDDECKRQYFQTPYDYESALNIGHRVEDEITRNLAYRQSNLSPELERAVAEYGSSRPYPAYWLLGAAHLAALRGDGNQAENYLAQAMKNGAEKHFPAQMALTRLMMTSLFEPLNGKGLENVTADIRNYLGTPKSANDPLRMYALSRLTEEVLARRFAEEGRKHEVFLSLLLAEAAAPAAEKAAPFVDPASLGFWAGLKSLFTDAEKQRRETLLAYMHTADFTRAAVEDSPLWFAALANFTSQEAIKTFGRLAKPSNGFEKFCSAVFQPGEAEKTLTIGRALIREGRYELAAEQFRNYRGDDPFALQAIGNPFEEPETHFEFIPDYKDKSGLFEKAAGIGNAGKHMELLAETVERPQSYFEFCQKARTLEKLAALGGEISALADYFQAAFLSNVESEGGYYLSYQPSPSPLPLLGLYDYRTMHPCFQRHEAALAKLKQCADKTANPELAVRAHFFLAAMSYDWQGTGYGYEGLRPYGQTNFGALIREHCPKAASYLD
ncbi:hypothetical protein C4J81_00840 [Deltaproteobacteria bacterium Smac51]|nr:hypothetical protein C4J81_00840 [Deltaproteobacteria bacterium Smac51]